MYEKLLDYKSKIHKNEKSQMLNHKYETRFIAVNDRYLCHGVMCYVLTYFSFSLLSRPISIHSSIPTFLN